MIRSTILRSAGALALAAALTLPAVTPAAAYERWVHHGGWHGGHEWHGGGWRGGGPCCGGGWGPGGVLLGLGVGAALGAALVAPPAYYAPPPAVYYGG